MKKPFVAIIGGRNAGKSTVIRSLTGCPTKNLEVLCGWQAESKPLAGERFWPQIWRGDPAAGREEIKRLVRRTEPFAFLKASIPPM